MDNIIIITTDDWKVIYVRGKKYIEGHHIEDEEWFKLGQKFPWQNWEEVKEYWFDDEDVDKIGGWFLESVREIPGEMSHK